MQPAITLKLKIWMIPEPIPRGRCFRNLLQRNAPVGDRRLQPAFLALAEAGALRGCVLDIGIGEHALMAAAFGLEATGVDTAATAIALARAKAHNRGLSAHFLVRNALQLASFGEQYDSVLDCGLFHVFDAGDRRSFVDHLAAVVRPGGRYFMLCFSELQRGDTGQLAHPPGIAAVLG